MPLYRSKQFRGALVKKSVDQTTADYSAGVAITWDAEDYDTDGIHEGVTNPSRLTVPASASYVRLGCTIACGAVTAGSVVTLQLRKTPIATGTTTSAFPGATGFHGTVQASGTVFFASGPIPVSPGDYFEVRMSHGDNSITLTAATSNFWLEVVA